jgi:hypothetical protein
MVVQVQTSTSNTDNCGKIISLYRQNSCIIKLHSPFHTTTIAQAALNGNRITFLQNVPNIVNSLPLTLDDPCDTLKVIFV